MLSRLVIIILSHTFISYHHHHIVHRRSCHHVIVTTDTVSPTYTARHRHRIVIVVSCRVHRRRNCHHTNIISLHTVINPSVIVYHRASSVIVHRTSVGDHHAYRACRTSSSLSYIVLSYRTSGTSSSGNGGLRQTYHIADRPHATLSDRTINHIESTHQFTVVRIITDHIIAYHRRSQHITSHNVSPDRVVAIIVKQSLFTSHRVMQSQRSPRSYRSIINCYIITSSFVFWFQRVW